MKCPRCDAEMSAEKKCGRCGFNASDSHDELEVEYKDFKTSELLEIRHKKHMASPDAETKMSAGQPGEDAAKIDGPASLSPRAGKKSSPALTAVVLIIALIIGGLFLAYMLLRK